MKNNQTIGKLFLILLLLISFIGFRSWSTKQSKSGVDNSYLTNIGQLKPELVSQFKLTQDDKSLLFEKKGNIWMVGDYQADPVAITELLTAILNPDSVELVATTNVKHLDFAVASASATYLEIDKESPSFIIGNSTSGGHFVRFNQQDNVYIVPKLPSNSTMLDLESWLNLSLISVNKDDLEEIRWSKKDQSFTLNQKDKQWTKDGDAQPIDSSTISGLLNTLESLISQKVIPEADLDTYNPNPYLNLIIKTKDKEFELSLYQNKDSKASDVMVKIKDRKGEFAITKSQAAILDIDSSSLVPATSESISE